jgi:hypothetical protein
MIEVKRAETIITTELAELPFTLNSIFSAVNPQKQNKLL